MEKIYEKVVKLTAEILKKSWNPDSGTVSPFSSSSSMHSESSDNHLEHYVQESPKTPLEGAIASIFNSNFWTNGGEKMENKTLDVDSSTTPKQQYNNPGTSTTEPDPQSEIAITKADAPKGSQDLEGKGTYSTTANTTEQAPAAGDTTEPTAKADGACPDCGKTECECDKVEKAATCQDCNKPMTMCMCDGMSKSDKCPHCGQSMPVKKSDDSDEDDKVEKAADEPESEEEDAKETPEDEKKEEMKKSLWDGSFSPNIKRGF